MLAPDADSHSDDEEPDDGGGAAVAELDKDGFLPWGDDLSVAERPIGQPRPESVMRTIPPMMMSTYVATQVTTASFWARVIALTLVG